MSYRYKYIFTIFILGVILTHSKGFAAAPVVICGEPWPPFLYETGDDEQGNKAIAGSHLKNLPLLEEATELEFSINLIPWKRCLSQVENYSQPGDPEIAIDASFSKERAAKFYYVGPMYTIGTAVWFSRNRFPDGPLSKKTGKVISWINEMQHYSICGNLGWNYDMYYVEHGIPRSNEIIRSPGGLQGMFSMLSKGRCDLVETHPELVMGSMIIGELKLPKDIACNKMQEEPEAFYLLIAKKSPRAEELVTRLSTALIYLQRTLQWKSLKDEGALPTAESMETLKACL